MSEREENIRLEGRAISPGVVIGSAFVYRDRLEMLVGAAEIQEHQIEETLWRTHGGKGCPNAMQCL
jgi:hypothetical protein